MKPRIHGFTVFHTIVSTYVIVSIELMLHWNKVSDVYTIRSVGQLIPFVIGLVGFLKIFIIVPYQTKVGSHDSSIFLVVYLLTIVGEEATTDAVTRD